MRDTLPEAEIVRRAAVRRLDPLDRLRQALDLSDAIRRLRDLKSPPRERESRSAHSASEQQHGRDR